MKRFLGSVILLLGAWACTADDDAATANDVAAGGGAGNVAPTMDASSGTSMNEEAEPPPDRSTMTMTGTGGGGGSDAKRPILDASRVVDVEQVDAPMACVKYCACMAMWCADKVFPTGCLVECTRQTNWELDCRANMCNLVKPQPDNDHCTHAFGVGQCTDN